MLSSLAAFLDTPAGPLLIGLSVYQEPADRNALLFQVGDHDYAASRAHDLLGPAPPFRPPADLADLTAACLRTGWLQRHRVGRRGDVPALLADERICRQLREILVAAGRQQELIAAHRRAADYWQWRATAWPQERRADIHDLLQARQHLLDAGEIGLASSLTGDICAQLRAWGSLDSEADLVRATLEAMPAPSAERAGWLHELGDIAQARRDYATAEQHYLSAIRMSDQLGDTGGVARGYESLGGLAHAQGDYRKAERQYRAAQAASQKHDPPGPDASSPPPETVASSGTAAGVGTATRPSRPHRRAARARAAWRGRGIRPTRQTRPARQPRPARQARPARWARRARWPAMLAALSAGIALIATTVAVAHVAAGTGPGSSGPGSSGPGSSGPRNSGPGNSGPRNSGPRNSGPDSYTPLVIGSFGGRPAIRFSFAAPSPAGLLPSLGSGPGTPAHS